MKHLRRRAAWIRPHVLSTALRSVLVFCALGLLFANGLEAQVRVRGYTRKDGTYVRPHVRTRPDGNPYNNYSYPGNYNPNTGEFTPGNAATYLRNYYNRTGTYRALATPFSPMAVLQFSLSALGYDAGPADGVWRPWTSTALRSFQASRSIIATGHMNAVTTDSLVTALDRLGTANISRAPTDGVLPGARPDHQNPDDRDGEGEGGYLRGGVHAALARCVGTDSGIRNDWAGCTDDYSEVGYTFDLEGGYAPNAWLDLGIAIGGGQFAFATFASLTGFYAMPVVRLNMPPVAPVTPYAEAGYGVGITRACGVSDYNFVDCDEYGHKNRNQGGVMLVGGGLRWNASERWRATLSLRRLDFTGDARTRSDHAVVGRTIETISLPVSGRTNTWQAGIGVEWRP